MIATVAVAIVGSLLGKSAFDFCIEYFEKYDKVKQAIDGIGANTSKTDWEIPQPVYYGTSPSPSTLGIFALTAFAPTPRRK